MLQEVIEEGHKVLVFSQFTSFLAIAKKQFDKLGLSYEYLIAAMRNYVNDQRTGNEDMPKILKALSESDREAIARYIAGL